MHLPGLDRGLSFHAFSLAGQCLHGARIPWAPLQCGGSNLFFRALGSVHGRNPGDHLCQCRFDVRRHPWLGLLVFGGAHSVCGGPLHNGGRAQGGGGDRCLFMRCFDSGCRHHLYQRTLGGRGSGGTQRGHSFQELDSRPLDPVASC